MLPEEIREFADELKSLPPWTPPMVVLRSATDRKQTGSTWQAAALGLSLGLLCGMLLGGLGVLTFHMPAKPETVEIVKFVEIPAPKPEPDASPGLDTPIEFSSSTVTAPFDPDALIGLYNERAKMLVRLGGIVSSPTSETPQLPDDPNAMYRLRESLKM